MILRTEEVDTLCLEETFLTNQVNDNQLSVERYELFSRDRTTGHGSEIVVFVHNRHEVSNLEEKDIEIIWLEVQQRQHPGTFLCGFIYRPPKTKAQTDSAIISNIETAALNSSEVWLVFSVHHGIKHTSASTSAKGAKTTTASLIFCRLARCHHGAKQAVKKSSKDKER